MTGPTVLVCQWYRPEPVAQTTWIVNALRDCGTDVEVLTGIPNYPSGCAADGYHAWKPRTEKLDGVTVHRAPLFPSHDASSVGRFLNYVSWAISASVVGLLTLRRSRAVLVYSSPATAALPAIVAKWLFGVQYVLLVQDVWPDSVFESGFLGGRAQKLIEAMLKPFVAATYRSAHHIAVISPGMVDLLASRGVPRSKLSVVYNWVDESEPAPVTDAPFDLRRRLGIGPGEFVLMYAGNHGPAQALDKAISAFIDLPDGLNAHLVLIGDGMSKKALIEAAIARDTSRIHFLDPVSRSEIAGLMHQADAQLVSLARRPLFAVTIPSKLQSALAAGQPVLVAADGDASAVVTQSGAGLAAPAEDAAAFRAMVRLMADLSPEERFEMGVRGNDLYQTVMSARVGARRLADLLACAATAKTRNPV